MKKLPALIFLIAAIGATSAVLAGETRKHEVVKLEIDDDNADSVSITLDSDKTGFSIHDLEVGESRDVVSDSGQAVRVTRTGDGITLNVDGTDHEIPLMSGTGGGDHELMILDDSREEIVEKDVRIIKMEADDGLIIMSGEPLDAATRQTIKAAIAAAGIDRDVTFIDSAHGNGKLHSAHTGNAPVVVQKRVVKTRRATDD